MSYRQLHDTGHKIRIVAKLHKVVPAVHYFMYIMGISTFTHKKLCKSKTDSEQKDTKTNFIKFIFIH